MSGMGTAPERHTARRQMAALERIAVLIPAWKPDGRLPALVEELLARGFRHVVVVDDGNGTAYADLFTCLACQAAVHICRHPQNRGKGRALKTGFMHLLATEPGLAGVVTADADGQHRPEDILRVAQALLEEVAAATPSPVLGVRSFTGRVPWKSRLGNLWTCRIFAWVTGTLLPDTQTGLRGLPVSLLPALLSVPGERYEFEMAMLVALCKTKCRVRPLPIETVYLEGNRSSHFHPVRDSLRVYAALFGTWLYLAFRPWPQRTPQPVLSRQQHAVEPALHSA